MADPAPVLTCDGDAVPAADARALSRRLHRAGFAALPLAWVLNVWLFRGATDPVVAANAAASKTAAIIAGAALAAWAAAFTVGGPRLVGAALYDKLNMGGLDLEEAWGLSF